MEELARYTSRGTRYRDRRYGRRPYHSRRYNPYRARASRYTPRYRRGRSYGTEPRERIESQYAPEASYAPGPEKQAHNEAEPKRLISRAEFFERYPPSFPEHWNEDFRKEVMDRMYDRYVENAPFNALREKFETEEKEKAERETKPESELENFEQDPQDRLLETIKEKGSESPEGRAAYEELLDIQLKEINRLEERDKLELRAEGDGIEKQEPNPGTEQGSEPELSQSEVEGAMEQLEAELFEETILEPSEVEERAEQLSEEALQMDAAEIEELVQDALADTEVESLELGAEPAYEAEEGETEVW